MRRLLDRLNFLLLLCLWGFAVWAWPGLPDRIPTHFGASGQPDAWSATTGLRWFALPTLASALLLLMAGLRGALRRRPDWVRLLDGRRLTDHPEPRRAAVLEALSAFLALATTELLVLFVLLHYGTYRAAHGASSLGVMILVLVTALLASPVLLILFFALLQRALGEGGGTGVERQAGGPPGGAQDRSVRPGRTARLRKAFGGARRPGSPEGAQPPSRRPPTGALLLALFLFSPLAEGHDAFLVRRPYAAAAQDPLELHGLRVSETATQDSLRVSSPDGRLAVAFAPGARCPTYALSHDGAEVIRPSCLGLSFRVGGPLQAGLQVRSARRRSVDREWEQPWGEIRYVRERFNELRVSLEEPGGGRSLDLVFRVFDDGMGFRYEFPQQAQVSEFELEEELTEFVLAGNANAWWIPAGRGDRYEQLYRSSPVSTLDTVHTPLTLKTPQGLYLALHEADLTDYASMRLAGTGTTRLTAALASWADGIKVRGRAPLVSPWRTIQVAERAVDLLTSYLILNLNEPSRIEDTSWIRPMRYAGIWWEMHLGISTWGSGPRHGATTEHARELIDFAADHGLGGVLVEGWNRGWDGEWSANGDLFSFTEPYPDFDLEAVAAYARERGVQLIGHHETAMGILNYERQLEAAFDLYRRLGVRVVKTGYVGNRTAEGHDHDGQYMVRHFRHVVETAARYGIALDVHEPIKDTGIRRTWPNMMTREGARGQEYNAWGGDGGNPPEHTTILPFTRMLCAPMDFTPGIFALERGRTVGRDQRPVARVNTTLAKQLALYVVLYSPLQMVPDLPDSYEGQPAFAFVREIPVDWERTVALAGEVGDFVVVARKDRHSEDWYLGAVSDEEGREIRVGLGFLDPGRRYRARIYADGPGAHWATSPSALAIEERGVAAGDTLTLKLAPGGGQAIRFRVSAHPPRPLR